MMRGGHLNYYPLNRYDGATGGGEESASGSTSTFCGRGRSWARASSRSSSRVARFCYARFPSVSKGKFTAFAAPPARIEATEGLLSWTLALDSCPTKIPNEDQTFSR